MTVFVRNFCIFFAQRISIYHQCVYTKYSFPQNALFFILNYSWLNSINAENRIVTVF